MNKRTNNLSTIVMLLCSVALVVIIYLSALDASVDSSPVGAPVDEISSSQVTNPSGSFPDEQFISTQTTSSTMAEITTPTTTTTTAAQPQQEERTLIISNPSANIRVGPGVDNELIMVAYQGEKYKIVGEKKDSGNVLWYEIELGSGTGYICANLTVSPEENYVKRAYLTFDDGPSENTRKILDILDRYGVKATFFVVYRSGLDDIYRDIVSRGNTIALHSYSHSYKTIYSSTDAYFSDLQRISDHVESLTGVRSNIIRFPGGSSNTTSKKHSRGIMSKLTGMVEDRGYIYFDWNVSNEDAEQTCAPKEELVEAVKSSIGGTNHAIILMHDALIKTTTVDALPEIIEFLLSEGYTILPITENTRPVHHHVNN